MNKHPLNGLPPFIVKSAGTTNCEPFHSTPGTWAGDWSIAIFVSGTGLYRYGENQIKIEPSTAILVPPEDPGLRVADVQDPYLEFHCRFSGEYAVYLATLLLERYPGRVIRDIDMMITVDCIRQMYFRRREQAAKLMGSDESLLATLLTTLLGDEAKKNSGLNRDGILSYLDSRLSQPTNLDLCADHFGVTKQSLCRIARRVLGQTIAQAHTAMKMEQAQLMLTYPDLPINEISQRLGYQDPFYFTRVFKKASGESPRSFRNSKTIKKDTKNRKEK